jgi:4-hydroxy-4-methyl-2-oxoglutarate aldolase
VTAVENAGLDDLEPRAKLRAAYLGVDTATVADVLDTMGLRHQSLATSIRPVTGLTLAGWAFTVSGATETYLGSGDPAKMAAAGEIGADEIGVWAGGGSGIAYFGELIGLGMQKRGARWGARHSGPP